MVVHIPLGGLLKWVPQSLRSAGRRVLKRVDVALHARAVDFGSPPEVGLFLPDGYRYWTTPQYYNANPPRAEVISQPDVYRVAEALAHLLGAETVVDLGCGKGGKLAALSGIRNVIGVDYGSNLEACRSEYPHAIWLEANLESEDALEIPVNSLRGAVIVSSDVVEHLQHPVRLLKRIHSMLETASIAVLSTPDRLLTRGPDHLGPPQNRSHVREWEAGEFERLLVSLGFRIVHTGHTRTNTLDTVGRTTIAVCAGSQLAAEQSAMASETVRSITRFALVPEAD